MSGGSLAGCCTPVNCGEMTPTTVTRTLLILTVFPTTAGSPAKRKRQ
jgi:hypothetical protein